MKNRLFIQFLALYLVFGDLLAAETILAETKPALSFELTGGGNQPGTVVFSRDLNWLATCRQSGKVEVWDVNKNSRVAEWQSAVESSPFDYRVGESPIAFLSNSTELLVAAGTNVAVRESLTGNVVRTLESPPAKVAAITLSPRGHRVVGSMDNFRQSVFWHLSDGKILSHLPTKRDPSRIGPPGRMRNRDAATGKVKLPVSIIPGRCRAFDRNGDRFAAGLDGFAQVDIWNLESGKCLDTLQPTLRSGSRATGLAFLIGQKLAAVFDERELSVFTLTTNTSTILIPSPQRSHNDSLEIRSLAVSGDERRLAVAGMRMGKRPGVFAPKGDLVFDVPMHGEVQVWDAVGMKLLVTIKGMPSEKFSQVALDDSGQRVIAVTTGVAYNAKMSGAMQHSEERAPKNLPRVSVWELPAR